MSGVQEYLIDQEVKGMKQLAEIAITKAMPTMFDVCKGMALWLCGQGGGKKEGQQTLEELTKYGDKLSEIPLNSDSVKAFTTIARKHGVSFSLSEDTSKEPPRHTVYFRANDTEAMTAAFKEYLGKEINKAKTNERGFKEKMMEAKGKVTVEDKDKTMRRGVEER